MNDTELQQLLDQTAHRLGVVGAQLSIYDSHRQRDFASGSRNRELEWPVTTDTVFQIGSTTKVFTAALAMSLVDSGDLDLDSPVREYIRDFRLANNNAQQTVTLRHLLSMSAGLDNGIYHDYGRGDDALGRYVQTLAGMPHIFASGSAFGYSNASTNVAGHAAAQITGHTWEQLLTERILMPLGLKHCRLLAEDLLDHPIALGYQGAPGEGMQRVRPNIMRSMGPSGAMTYCSAGDLVRLGRMFLDHGRSADGVQVLSERAIETMQDPQVTLPTRLFADQWCVGPYRKVWGGYVLYGHSGTTRVGSSMLLWCPKRNVAIATVVNVPNQGYPLADAVFDVVFPRLFGIEKPAAIGPESVLPVRVDLRPYVGRFEAFGVTLNFDIHHDSLYLSGTMWSDEETRCELIGLGDGRFLPADASISGNRNWDVAFWGSDAHGCATHFLQGVFPLRRTR